MYDLPGSLMARVKRLFKKAKEPSRCILPEDVEHESPMAREVISRCFNSGDIIVGNIDEDGNLHITSFDDQGNKKIEVPE